MKTIPTTEVRKHLGQIIEEVNRTGHSLGIERHGRVEAILFPAPRPNPNLSLTTNLATFSKSFDFLLEEPDIYTDADLKKRYG